MKAYWGNGCIDLRILDLGTRWRWVVSLTPRPLYSQGKSPWYPLDRRLGDPQSLPGRGGEEKNSQPPICFPIFVWKIIAVQRSRQRISPFANLKCLLCGLHCNQNDTSLIELDVGQGLTEPRNVQLIPLSPAANNELDFIKSLLFKYDIRYTLP
jgi:hypothetical protein